MGQGLPAKPEHGKAPTFCVWTDPDFNQDAVEK